MQHADETMFRRHTRTYGSCGRPELKAGRQRGTALPRGSGSDLAITHAWLDEVIHYTEHYACFACRRAFKHREQWPPKDREPAREYPPYPPAYRPCPECGAPARSLGEKFKPPRRESKNQWRKLELLARLDMLFHSYGWRPKTYSEAKRVARREGRL